MAKRDKNQQAQDRNERPVEIAEELANNNPAQENANNNNRRQNKNK